MREELALITVVAMEAGCTVAETHDRVAQLVGTRTLAHLVTVQTICARLACWQRQCNKAPGTRYRSDMAFCSTCWCSANARIRELRLLANYSFFSLTLLTAVASEASGTATLAGHMVTGSTMRTVTVLRTVLTIGARQTRCGEHIYLNAIHTVCTRH